MNAFQLLLLVFLVVPLVEIYVLIKVGSELGAATTIALVVLTAVVGAALMRAQGFRTFTRVQHALAAGEIPAVEMLEGVFILAAGALLLTPGFVTDAIGFTFLIPPLRVRIIQGMIARQARASAREPGHRAGRVIEGEFERKNDR